MKTAFGLDLMLYRPKKQNSSPKICLFYLIIKYFF